ncbi:MAG: endonuclease [Streptosporangiaceae bacterium]
MVARQEDTVRVLLDRAGTTFAEDAGIRVDNKPAPLYQVLVLAQLLSARISGKIAIATARELFRAGFTTPRRMADAGWQERVDALGRGGYRRYDESTSTTLGESATMILDRYRGDLRRMAEEADDDPRRMRTLVKEVKGIGDTGASIFFREVQGAWPALRPSIDKKGIQGAGALGLPEDPHKLGELVDGADLPRLASALVRVARDADLAATVRAAA